MWEIPEYERLAGTALAAVARYVESQAAEVPVGSPPELPELIDRLGLRELVRAGGLDVDSFES